MEEHQENLLLLLQSSKSGDFSISQKLKSPGEGRGGADRVILYILRCKQSLRYMSCKAQHYVCCYTDKKEIKIFLIYKDIQMGSSKSYMRKGFLIYEEMHKYFHHILGGR